MIARKVDMGLAMAVRVVGGASANEGQVRRRPTATVCGSFRRHPDDVVAALEEMRKARVDVLSPTSFAVESVQRGFTRLRDDAAKDPATTEDRHLDAIAHSDFVWLVLPDGKPGRSTSMELGYATAVQVPAFTADPIRDETLKRYVVVVGSVREAVKKVSGRRVSPGPTLLLNPRRAISVMNGELAKIDAVLASADGPLNAQQNEAIRAAGTTMTHTLGNLGRKDDRWYDARRRR
jgi:hypothetical protein